MINALRKVSIVSNRKETLSLKEFMNKKKGKHENVQSSLCKIAESKFGLEKKGHHNFMQSALTKIGVSKSGQTPRRQLNFEQSKSLNGKRRSVIAYSLYINPLAFFDPTFVLIGVGVVAVAILEKKLAESGLISIAAFLSNILRLALPGVALASIIYLINHASFLL